MTQTPQDAAEALFAAIPHVVARDVLEEYGIEAETVQMQQLTQELLSLSLFRIHWALRAAMAPKPRELVLEALRRRIRDGWSTDLALDGADPDEYFVTVDERRQTYEQAMQHGAGPADMANEVAALLVSNSAVQPDDRSKVLGLIIDLVPDEELVDLAEEMRVGS